MGGVIRLPKNLRKRPALTGKDAKKIIDLENTNNKILATLIEKIKDKQKKGLLVNALRHGF